MMALYEIPLWRETALLTTAALMLICQGWKTGLFEAHMKGLVHERAAAVYKRRWSRMSVANGLFDHLLFVALLLSGCDAIRVIGVQILGGVLASALVNMARGNEPFSFSGRGRSVALPAVERRGGRWEGVVRSVDVPTALVGPRRWKAALGAAVVLYEPLAPQITSVLVDGAGAVWRVAIAFL